jgi:hypothetical protein
MSWNILFIILDSNFGTIIGIPPAFLNSKC